jgi:hypothetical protein
MLRAQLACGQTRSLVNFSSAAFVGARPSSRKRSTTPAVTVEASACLAAEVHTASPPSPPLLTSPRPHSFLPSFGHGVVAVGRVRSFRSRMHRTWVMAMVMASIGSHSVHSVGRSLAYIYIHRSVGLSWQARSVGRWLAMYGSLAVAAAGRARVRVRDCECVRPLRVRVCALSALRGLSVCCPGPSAGQPCAQWPSIPSWYPSWCPSWCRLSCLSGVRACMPGGRARRASCTRPGSARCSSCTRQAPGQNATRTSSGWAGRGARCGRHPTARRNDSRTSQPRSARKVRSATPWPRR